MDSRLLPVPTDSEIAAEFRRQGLVPGDVEGLFRRAAASSIDTLGPLAPVTALVADLLNNHPDEAEVLFLFARLFSTPNYAFLDPPVSPAARFFALPPDDAVDRIKIGHAPKLQLLGFLHPRNHVLELGNTVIKARTRVSPSTMVPSVTFLAMEVHFGVRNDLKMIPSVLRCFPNVMALHIRSGKTDQSTGKLNLNFWYESGAIECIHWSIKRLDFYDFQAGRSELAFLKIFFETAFVLEEVVIQLATSFTSMEEVHSKLESLGSIQLANEACSVLVTGCPGSDQKWSLH
ncbi:hypothetical protein ACQ4PT_045720 [Festuca glaucescens]